MPTRLRLLLSLIVLIATPPFVHFATDHPTKTETSPSVARPASLATSPTEVRLDLTLAAAEMNPCFDYDALEAGTADPVRQDHFNHLLPADYLRWRGACAHDANGRLLYNMDGAEWDCLRRKINAESGWYEQRVGPRGPAGVTYGIPQAYPGEKMASHGPDWRTNGRVQVRWLLDYIEGRYGSEWNTPRPCRAGY